MRPRSQQSPPGVGVPGGALRELPVFSLLQNPANKWVRLEEFALIPVNVCWWWRRTIARERHWRSASDKSFRARVLWLSGKEDSQGCRGSSRGPTWPMAFVPRLRAQFVWASWCICREMTEGSLHKSCRQEKELEEVRMRNQTSTESEVRCFLNNIIWEKVSRQQSLQFWVHNKLRVWLCKNSLTKAMWPWRQDL